MKQKLIIILTSIVILLFTGCDAILNSAYPEYDLSAGEEFVNNEIRVNLDVPIALTYDSNPIKVMLIPVYGGTYDIHNTRVKSFYNYSYINTYFDFLGKETYSVIVFHDVNNNDKPDTGERGILLRDSFNKDVFDFRSYNESTTLFGTENFTDSSLLSPAITNAFENNTIDYSFNISGPDYLSYSGDADGNSRFYITPNNSNLAVESIEWQITDHQGAVCGYYYNWAYQTGYMLTNGNYVDIYYSNLQHLLDDDDNWWSGYDMYINFKVHYVGGGTYEGVKYINLY
ncbi:hypothetical protein EW093_16075 [Thiospirochaeta perfilievii]|uniref:Uncharacterized protein n=1 Tax=Thiospirochaeta perfilievii TaxID=252967 RepID=A0A5C1QGE2_9SPIO|nr:hypothetical protein [Thiospirochaeta perfilievii]QEN06139.1 hypothetical protein EW093_16075 [Thiospirochaeta perfilievii]